eukprot:3826648-Rhodomonas_salina.1
MPSTLVSSAATCCASFLDLCRMLFTLGVGAGACRSRGVTRQPWTADGAPRRMAGGSRLSSIVARGLLMPSAQHAWRAVSDAHLLPTAAAHQPRRLHLEAPRTSSAPCFPRQMTKLTRLPGVRRGLRNGMKALCESCEERG